MAETFLISDTHFGHRNIINFSNEEDSFKKLRPFTSVEEMDEHMVERWNSVVTDRDLVYHLGDVVINRRCLPILSRLKGRKRLVKGNHDLFRLSEFTPYFEDIYGVVVLNDLVCSHIPLMKSSIRPRYRGNIHGHTHGKILADPDYFSVCVEMTAYTPMPLHEISAVFTKRHEQP